MGRTLISLALVVLLAAGCAGPEQPEAPPPPEAVGAEDAEPVEPGAETGLSDEAVVILDDAMSYPLVPETTAETYGLEGRDAAMFLGAMAQFEGFEKPSDDLWLPNVEVLGEYEEGGDTVLVTWVQIWQLYGYRGPDVPMSAGGGGNYAVMRLREQKEGIWECREAIHNYFSDPREFLLENCGAGHLELVEAALAVDTDAPPEGTAWFSNMDEALAVYQAYNDLSISYVQP